MGVEVTDQVNTRLMNFSSVSSLTFPQYTAAITGSDLSEEQRPSVTYPIKHSRLGGRGWRGDGGGVRVEWGWGKGSHSPSNRVLEENNLGKDKL